MRKWRKREVKEARTVSKRKFVNYSKWGYFFIAPFFIVYIIFSLFPLVTTFYDSFFENYRVGLVQVGPTFVGFANYLKIFESDILKYGLNTVILWVLNFIPQITVSLLLAIWFTSYSLNLKGQQFFKTIIYMPNLIMASAFSMLFFTLFSDGGPINLYLGNAGLIKEPIRFLARVDWTRTLICIMNFMMWFGNTTILLMSGIMGIDVSLFEAARIDGASSLKTFTKVTMPLLLPIFVYVLITSLIGGIQMFDVPQILTNGNGAPDRTSMTLVMFLNKHLASKNFGLAGAVSVLIFFVTVGFSVLVYNTLMKNYDPKRGAK
jgi:multiple sugar transport system permease protein